MLTGVEGDETNRQPGRVESSYPLKGDAERRKCVTGLQQLTVDLLALHNMYKEAHWDLTGPLFLPLHEYYQRQADFYLQQADLFAERVLQLGSIFDGRFATIARTTKLAEMPEGYLTDDHSLKLLLDRVSVLQKELRVDRPDGGERPADEQPAAGPGARGGQGPVEVAAPPAAAQLATRRSPLGPATDTRPFGPVRVAPSAIAHRRWGGWYQSATGTQEDPPTKTGTPQRRPPAPARAPSRAAQESTTSCPCREGPDS
jgi:DNA-binding ferritin-like protein